MRASNRHVSLQSLIEVAGIMGCAFEATDSASFPAGVSSYTIFRTGSKPVIIHSREISYDGIGGTVFTYRDPVYTGGMVRDLTRNPNDISPMTSEVTIISGSTVTDLGVESRSTRYLIGPTSQQAQGSSPRETLTPHLMLPNKEILFVIRNDDSNSAQTFAVGIGWIEIDNIPQLEIVNGEFVKYQGVAL